MAPARINLMKRFCVVAFCVWVSAGARAEVLSLTLGIDVNSPYGISEPWATIRAGLLRLDYVESVAELPDRKTRTGEMRTKNGRVPDVDALATALRELGAGATLRGIEATITGTVSRDGKDLSLKVGKTGEILRLAPLTRRVQRDAIEITDKERNAFTELASRAEPAEVRITGPLRARAGQGSLQTLEVRTFEFSGRTQNQTNHQN